MGVAFQVSEILPAFKNDQIFLLGPKKNFAQIGKVAISSKLERYADRNWFTCISHQLLLSYILNLNCSLLFSSFSPSLSFSSLPHPSPSLFHHSSSTFSLFFCFSIPPFPLSFPSPYIISRVSHPDDTRSCEAASGRLV